MSLVHSMHPNNDRHAYISAGNLLACDDGRLCYLDFGMMSYAASEQRNGFLLAVVHIVNRDWGALVRLYQKLGFIPDGTDLEPIETALENALPDVLNADISELNFKTVVNELGDIMYTYPFSLPPFYIAIIRCLGVLEGLAIQVDPQARIISEAYPYVASRVLTDSQNDLQEALRGLALNSDGSIRWERLESLLEEAKDSSGYVHTTLCVCARLCVCVYVCISFGCIQMHAPATNANVWCFYPPSLFVYRSYRP